MGTVFMPHNGAHRRYSLTADGKVFPGTANGLDGCTLRWMKNWLDSWA